MRLFIISLFLLYWTEFCKVRAEKNISFWQITDIHYDKFYMYHGNKAESCHGINGSAEKFGEYSCEAGKDLFISSVKGLNISKGIFYCKRKIVNGVIMFFMCWTKLYIPSTLNIDLILWHTQLIVCVENVKSWFKSWVFSFHFSSLYPAPYIEFYLNFIFEF